MFHKVSDIEKVYGKEGGGGRREGASKLSVKIFFVSVPKNFVGEHFSVSLISGIEKFYAWEG